MENAKHNVRIPAKQPIDDITIISDRNVYGSSGQQSASRNYPVASKPAQSSANQFRKTNNTNLSLSIPQSDVNLNFPSPINNNQINANNPSVRATSVSVQPNYHKTNTNPLYTNVNPSPMNVHYNP